MNPILLECWDRLTTSVPRSTPLPSCSSARCNCNPRTRPSERLRKIEGALGAYDLRVDELVPLLVEFPSVPAPESHYPPVALAPQLERRTVLQALVTVLLAQAADHPVVFILEDRTG